MGGDERPPTQTWPPNISQAVLVLPLVVSMTLLTRYMPARDVDRSDEQLSMLREGLTRARSLILYGISKGPALADMQPFHGTASMFLLEVCTSTRLQCSSFRVQQVQNNNEAPTRSLLVSLPNTACVSCGYCCCPCEKHEREVSYVRLVLTWLCFRPRTVLLMLVCGAHVT